jgi:hypothetical protein
MEAALPVLALVHTLGAALGAAGVTFAEILYLKASADGRIDRRERDYVRAAFWALKWGMGVVLLSSIALIFAQYAAGGAQLVLMPAFWASLTLALVILLCGYELSKKRIPWAVATGFGFAAWWAILAIDAWRGIPLGYGPILFSYLVFAFISMGAWGYARLFVTRSIHPRV